MIVGSVGRWQSNWTFDLLDIWDLKRQVGGNNVKMTTDFTANVDWSNENVQYS